MRWVTGANPLQVRDGACGVGKPCEHGLVNLRELRVERQVSDLR